MALSSWLASLKSDVHNVSAVQAFINAGLGRYVTETADVKGVSGWVGMVASDTADAAGEIQTYQAQPAWSLACTGDTADACKKSNADFQISEAALVQTKPNQMVRRRGPWLTDTKQAVARIYHLHHFNCNTCIAAGRGTRYGKRCTVGLALWNTYRDADSLNQSGTRSMGS